MGCLVLWGIAEMNQSSEQYQLKLMKVKLWKKRGVKPFEKLSCWVLSAVLIDMDITGSGINIDSCMHA